MSRSLSAIRMLVCAISLVCCRASLAIVVGSTSYTDSDYTSAPSGNALPEFYNVGGIKDAQGNIGVGTVVYIGNGWVLSANHIGFPVKVSLQGTDYDVDPASRINNLKFYNGSTADLQLFQLQLVPQNLPILQLMGSGLSVGDHVYLVGSGGSRTGVNGNAFTVAYTGDVRWGENEISSFDQLGFNTTFDSPQGTGLASEGQTYNGDSGGAAIVNGKLAGIIQSGVQDGQQAPFGAHSGMIRMTLNLRRQILAITQTETVPAQPSRTGDFDSDGIIGVNDIDTLAADIRNATTNVGTEDLNGDGVVDKADYFLLVGSLVDTSDDLEDGSHGTHFGDARLSGYVDTDAVFQSVMNFFGVSTPHWRNGDFDGDGTVGGSDLNLAVPNIGLSGPWARSGDFNGDYKVDAADIAILAADIRNNTTNADEDLNGDSVVDGDDMDELVGHLVDTDLGFGDGTHYGDANLDGTVDGADFGILAANFGLSNIEWEDGDFNGDGIVDGADFGLLSANFGQSGGMP